MIGTYRKWVLVLMAGLSWSAGVERVAAANLAVYQFTTSLNVTTEDPLVTAAAFSGTGTGRSSNSYAFQYPQTVNSGYMEFSLQADPGYGVDLAGISFSYDFLQSSGGNAPVNASIALYYSLDGFSSSTLVQSYGDTSGTNISNPAFTSTGVLDLAGVPSVAAVFFRFVLANESSLNTAAYRYAIDNVTVTGEIVAVPEPASCFLLGLGLTVLILFRCRRAS